MAHTPAQLSGVACIVCADESGPVIPVDVVDGCQVFAHRPCVDGTAPARNTLLVVGNTDTADDLADLVAFAYDVADRLQMHATVAVGRDVDVTQFEGVILHDSYMDSVNGVVLGFEAREADVFCVDAGFVYAFDPATVCGHCFEEGAEPVLDGNTWVPSMCAPCETEAARVAAEGVSLPAV
ncbi:hypothetical protein [Streptomyces bobili]|uniref:hypothetical protein n=1 Tax=Streptomyces bobili TaxID=67280 RepID=UPI000A3A6214|nr:hypothetical protein [Streptomyces bobili]